MTDEQCQALIAAIKELALAISMGADKISEAIDSISTTYTGEIEKRIGILTEVIDNASYRGACNHD
jgi:hypothetical protein